MIPLKEKRPKTRKKGEFLTYARVKDFVDRLENLKEKAIIVFQFCIGVQPSKVVHAHLAGG